MGFYVICSGADLLKQLNKDADKFLGEPYALYIVALATNIDDKALKWLIEYEMDFDSITGSYAAFLLFYNEALLNTKTPLAWFNHEIGVKKENEPQEVLVDSHLLRSGKRAVDSVLRYDANIQTKKKVLLHSMTYESDTVAIELGILDQLPCLLFIDDPNSLEFHLMPLREPDSMTMKEIRQLLGQFFKENKNTEFFNALREWHRKKEHQRKLMAEVEHLKAKFHSNEIENNLKLIEQHISEARNFLLERRVKASRKKVRELVSLLHSSGEDIPWESLRSAANKIPLARDLETKHLNAATTTDTLTPTDSQTIEKMRIKAYEILQISQEVGQSMSLLEIAQSLNKFILLETDNTIKVFTKTLGLRWENGRPIQYIWTDIEDSIKKLDHSLEEDVARSKMRNRPSIIPYLEAHNSRKKKAIVIQSIKQSATSFKEEAPTIMEAIAKGIQMIL